MGGLRIALIAAVAGLAWSQPAVAGDAQIRFAPTVTLSGHCGFEPSIAVDPQRNYVYVTSPGTSDRSSDSSAAGRVDGHGRCEPDPTSRDTSPCNPYWVSADGGRTFGNKVYAGTVLHEVLSCEADVAVDPGDGPAGRVFGINSETFQATDLCSSLDHGATWSAYPPDGESCQGVFNAGGQLPGIDRPWVVFRAPSQRHPHHDLFILTEITDALASNQMWLSRDGARPIPLPALFTADAGFATQTGDVALASRPVVEPSGDLDVLLIATGRDNPGSFGQVWFARLHDPGDSDQAWQLTQLLNADTRFAEGSQAGLNFPYLAADSSGSLYALVSGDITGRDPSALDVWMWSSGPAAAAWSGPTKLNPAGRGRALPAVLGGASAGQLLVGWYRSLNTLDQCDDGKAADPVNGATWVYEIAESDDARSNAPHFETLTLNGGTAVHYGTIDAAGATAPCGGASSLVGQGEEGRGIGDFSSMAFDSYGCALVVYADDHKVKFDESNRAWNLSDNAVARQTDGCIGPGKTRQASRPRPASLPNTSPLPDAFLPGSFPLPWLVAVGVLSLRLKGAAR